MSHSYNIFRGFGYFDYEHTKDLTTHFTVENIESSKRVHDQGKLFFFHKYSL